MRRPVVFILIGFSGGIILGYIASLVLYLILGISACLLFLSGLFLKNHGSLNVKCLSFFLLVILFGSFSFHMTEKARDPVSSYEGQRVEVMGTILSVREKGEGYHHLVIRGSHYRKGEGAVYLPCDSKWLVPIKGVMKQPEDFIGRRVKVTAKVEIPTGARNPGLFDYQLYLKTMGIQTILSAKTDQMKVSDTGADAFLVLIAKVKYGFLNQVRPLMEPEAYGIFIGMLFGDVSHMEEDVYEAFQKNGIGHILSVSGIHVAMVYLYISRLFPGRNGLCANGIAILLLVVYAALSEFSPPVVRAVLMIVIHILSKITFQPYDFTTCISASALIMLVKNPYYLFNTGFQLTYLAVFCLAVLLPRVNLRLEKIKGNKAMEGRRKTVAIKIATFIAPLLVIQIGMMPLTAYLFNYFSLAAFFMNIPVIALSGAIIPIGITLIPLSFLGENLLFGVGLTAAELLIKWMTWLNDFFYLPGIGYFHTTSPAMGFVLVFYALLFFLSCEMTAVFYQRKQFETIGSLVVILTLLLFSFAYATDKGYHRTALTFLDVGQGDCLHIRTPGGKNILIDGGGNSNYNVGKKILLPYLLKNGVSSLDLAIVTHLHDDHYLGLTQLSDYLKVEKLGVYAANRYGEEEIAEDMGIGNQDILYLAAGAKIHIEEGIWIEVLYPEPKSSRAYKDLYFHEEDENKSSLLLMLHYKDLKVLMTGDLGFEGENRILKAYEKQQQRLNAHVLKVGHHGSKNSTGDDFLDTVAPDLAVFQVGKNNIYGHPHGSVLEKCENRDIMIYRNDLKGAIILDRQEQTWQVRTML